MEAEKRDPGNEVVFLFWFPPVTRYPRKSPAAPVVIGRIPCLWIPDSLSGWIPDFKIPEILFWILDSISWIPDSKAVNSGFHRTKLPRFRIPDYLTWGETVNRMKNLSLRIWYQRKKKRS